MAAKPPKILFISPLNGYMVVQDIRLLKAHFRVVEVRHPWSKRRWLNPWYLVVEFLQLLWHLPGTHAVVVSFGGYGALFPPLMGRLTRTPVYIILHGADAVSMPSIRYGSLRKPWLKRVLKVAYQNATCLLPVSEALLRTHNPAYPVVGEQTQGVLHFFPGLTTPTTVVNNGIDLARWPWGVFEVREPRSFFTVCVPGQIERKGLKGILELAGRLPNCAFYVAGMNAADLPLPIPPNVKPLGFLQHEELVAYYQRSTFFIQLALFEAFGLAVIEAMACGCIPVVSAVCGLPERVGEAGFVVPTTDPDGLQAFVEGHVLTAKDLPARSQRVREQVATHFQESNRAEQLVNILSTLRS